MEQLKFDPKFISIVDINLLDPNSWNPKDKNTEQFETIKGIITKKGLKLPVVVRTKGDRYEIVDGEQRWTACKELDWKNIIVYNLGEISDQEAMETTIDFEQQVPFNEIKLAHLIKKMVNDFKDLALPYKDEMIKNYVEMANFNWEDVKDNAGNLEDGMTVIKVTAEQYEIIKQAISKAQEGDETMSEGRALELIAGDYLAGK